MARPKRFELLTPRFVVWCSIQLSYGRMLRKEAFAWPTQRADSYRPGPRMARLFGKSKAAGDQAVARSSRQASRSTA